MKKLSDCRVLLVDDAKPNLDILVEGLKSDHKLSLALNGETALQIATRIPPDLVLLDIMMPGMDGYETMRAIRQDPRHRLLPMIALTAKAMKGDREKCLEAGASDYIAKPVNTDQLLSLLRVWLHR